MAKLFKDGKLDYLIIARCTEFDDICEGENE